MIAEERLEQMLLLCSLSRWTFEEFVIKLKEGYPVGLTPDGKNPWDESVKDGSLKNLYDLAMQ